MYTMYPPIPNPPSKFACPCFAWTQQQRDRLDGPQQGSTYKNPAFEFKQVETIERPKKPLCKSCRKYLFAGRMIKSKFLGKRLALDDGDVDEKPHRPMTVDVERAQCDSSAGMKKIIRKYFTVEKDERDHRGTLPAPKRRAVDIAADGTQKTAIPRRQSPTRACAKLASRKRHMKDPRVCLNKPRKDCCFNAMDFYYHIGNSPPITDNTYTMPSSPTSHMSETPVASSNSGIPSPPTTTTTNISLSPVVPGKEVTMVDVPPTNPINIKPHVAQHTTSSPFTAKSSIFNARQPPSANVTINDVPEQRGPSAPTSQPWAPAAGAGYSTSSKACQPQKKTASQATQPPSAPAAGAGYSTSSKACQPQKKKQPPTPGVNILFKR